MDKRTRRKIIEENVQKPDLPTQHYSIFIRHLDCGSCNGCELELNALANPIYDIAQYGIHFEASPRHADILAMTGVFTRNLAEAAQLTLEAMPTPRIITIGDCTDDGGIFRGSYALAKRPEEIEKSIIAHVPGCPPIPEDITKALLELASDSFNEKTLSKKSEK
jgi:Ni,Fe-hydrogenase III small subunit